MQSVIKRQVDDEMKKRGIATLLVCVMMACLYLVAEKRPQPVEKNQVYIGVACYNQSDTFLQELLHCFREKCRAYGEPGYDVTVTIRDAAGSQWIQNDQVEDLIQEGCNVLCVNLADRTDPSAIIDVAKKNNVPIIFFNREPVAEDLMQWDKLYYVGAKAQQSGMMQGELAADIIWKNKQVDRNGDGRIQYVVLEGEMGHQDAIIRTESAVETIREKGIELEKYSYEIANWNRAQAQNRMTQMIAQYQDSIELVLANNDAMALGAIDAYDKLGYAKDKLPVFVGIDGTTEGLKAVQDGKLAATVYNDKEGQAEAMARLALAVVTGEGMDELEFENQQYIYLPYSKVTPENVDTYQLMQE